MGEGKVAGVVCTVERDGRREVAAEWESGGRRGMRREGSAKLNLWRHLNMREAREVSGA